MKKSESKSWYTSKTVWFNLLTIGGAVIDGLFGLMPLVQPVVPVEYYPWVMFTVGLVNVGIRSITDGPIDWTGEKDV